MSAFDAVQDPPFSELALAYGRGLLTPFTGAGISRPACPSWEELVVDLETVAGIAPAPSTGSANLIRRASHAVQALRHRREGELARAIKHSMYHRARSPDGGMHMPPQTTALADIWWPLVLTTNYETLFIEAWNKRWVEDKIDPLPEFTRMVPVGRGRNDCQRILNSTRSPDNPLLWALQGFIGDGNHQLAAQLTIGHEEYRRQTHEAVYFRRAFAEIYRSRVLLFVGSGLQESYLLELFGEALELLGTIGHFHYALVPRGSADPDFLERRFQIRAIEYAATKHKDAGACVAEFLVGLRNAIIGPRARTCAWSMVLGSNSVITAADERADITVIRGMLPPARDPGVATAVSAGHRVTANGHQLFIGRPGRHVIRERGLELDTLKLEHAKGTHIHRIKEQPIYVVVARDLQRSARDARDARDVAPAIRELMVQVVHDGFRHVNIMLLASGRHRTFPQHLALHEMVRGYCQWHATARPQERIPMRIYTVDPALIALLESRRIDLSGMIDSSEVRFWIEVRMGPGSPAPALAAEKSTATMRDVLRRYAIPETGWIVSVRPTPTRDYEATPIEELVRGDAPTLAEFGLLNGSTLIFARL
jgi:hypothetical protein